MDTREQRIMGAVDALADDIIGLTMRLTAEPSTLLNEASAVNVMESAMMDLGHDPIRVPVDPARLESHPGFAKVPWDYDPQSGRHNLVATVKGQDSSAPTALLNGHLDVVDVGPLEYWDNDPFEPVVKDGWMYGRGAGDMKSGVAAMVYAAKAVETAGFALQGDVILETVIEEECCGNGALACLDAGYDADAVLIPEPFGPTILTNQVGVLWFKVSVGGLASHVLDTKAGANAIEKLFPLIQGLRTLEAEMNEEPRPEPYTRYEHPLNLNVGIVKGGEWPSTVPASAEMHCRLSFFPGQDYEATCRRITDCIEATAAGDPWLSANPPETEFYAFRSKGHTMDPELPALKTLGGCHHSLTGVDPEEYIATCTTDLRAFTSYGNGVGTCYGPVAKDIHGANECVNLDSIIHTAKAYSLFLARWCGLAE